MNSLIQHIRTLIGHRVQISSSPPMPETQLALLDDYCRQMEDYLDVVSDITETLAVGVKQLRRKQRHFETLVHEANVNIETFSHEGQDKLAKAAAERKLVLSQAVKTCQQEADHQNARLLEFMDAKLQLEARLIEINRERALLEAQLDQDISLQPM